MITVAEKINASLPTTRKILETRDAPALAELAADQAAAGAGFIDVNVGTGHGSREDEVEAMRWAVGVIQEAVETPLAVDSADPLVLEAGLEARGERPTLINSTKATAENLEAVVPLAARAGASLAGLAMDESGIPKTAAARLAACGVIADACARHGLPLSKVFFDPLVLPVATEVTQGTVTLETLMGIKKRFPEAGTVLAVSNISFGLPQRQRANTAFLHMAVFAGLDAAICNVLDRELMGAVRTAEALVGKDRHCRRYCRYFRS